MSPPREINRKDARSVPSISPSRWLVALVAPSFDWLGAVAEKNLHPRGL